MKHFRYTADIHCIPAEGLFNVYRIKNFSTFGRLNEHPAHCKDVTCSMACTVMRYKQASAFVEGVVGSRRVGCSSEGKAASALCCIHCCICSTGRLAPAHQQQSPGKHSCLRQRTAAHILASRAGKDVLSKRPLGKGQAEVTAPFLENVLPQKELLCTT